MWWHTVTHARESEGKTCKWGGYSVLFTLPRNMVYPRLLPLMLTPRLTVVDWTDVPVDLNGLVRFAERRNLVSARVPSHFKPSLTTAVEVNISKYSNKKVRSGNKCFFSEMRSLPYLLVSVLWDFQADGKKRVTSTTTAIVEWRTKQKNKIACSCHDA
jgi:hypothetical protein